MRADLEVLLEVAVEDHLLAGGALVPEILRHLAPPEQGADLRADVFGEPAHAAILRAAHARGASAAHLGRAPISAASGAGRPAASRCSRQRLDQRRADHRGVGDARDFGRLRGRADAEADRDRQVGEARRRGMRTREARRAVALRVPVMPVMLT